MQYLKIHVGATRRKTDKDAIALSVAVRFSIGMHVPASKLHNTTIRPVKHHRCEIQQYSITPSMGTYHWHDPQSFWTREPLKASV